MKISEMRARLSEILTELDELAELDEPTDEQVGSFDELRAEAEDLETRIKNKAEQAEFRARIAEALETEIPERLTIEPGDNSTVRQTGDPFDLSEIRWMAPNADREVRDRAHKALEALPGWELDDANKERITRMLETSPARNEVAGRMLATSSPAYKEAFVRQITGRPVTDPDQLEALAYKERVYRAMSLTDASGGFAIPLPIDPTLIVLGDGSSNPFRSIGRVEQVTTDTWQGVASTAMTASWDGEAAEVSDDTTTYTRPQITVYKAQAFVPASIEISVDYPGLVDDLRQQFGMAKDDLEATAFATGTGTNQPIGIVTAIDGTGNDIGTATTDTYAVADVYTTHETLGPRYRGRGTWAMNAAIINDTRAFGTAVAHTFSGTLTDAPPDRVLGRPLVEASAMDGTINAGAENNIVVFGDFSNYVIADRVGGSLEFIPHLFATANNLPSGQRGWYFWWRVGADSVNDDAFVLLNAT